jgi:hypothetical protein
MATQIYHADWLLSGSHTGIYITTWEDPETLNRRLKKALVLSHFLLRATPTYHVDMPL